jgi:mannitol/fructose-specific phosphotransferase system IIA component (Ntr-type)
MKITRYLKPGHIRAELGAADPPAAIAALAGILAEAGALTRDKAAELVPVLLEREAQSSTGVGHGLALPHARTDLVDRIQVAFARSGPGVAFKAPDGEPARFLFLVLAPVKEATEYLKVLSQISLLMRDKDIRRDLLRARTADDLYKILDRGE